MQDKVLRQLEKTEERDFVGSDYNLINGVKDRLKGMRVDFKSEQRVGLYSVDFQLTGKKIAIEVDGPSHFICPTMQLTGSSSAKQRYLRRCGKFDKVFQITGNFVQ